MNAKKNTQNPATKATEIQMLEEIHSLDGYLADSISQDTLQTMTSNIRSDFPVFMGTSLDPVRMERLQGLNVELEAGIASRNLEIDGLTDTVKELQSRNRKLIILAIRHECEEDLEGIADHEEVIRIKLQEGIPINDADAQALLTIMDMVG